MFVDDYAERFRKLKVNRRKGYFSPHKPCLLLAVIDLAESGKLTQNKIYFDDVLITRYIDYFNIVKTDRDHPRPWTPFFALKNENKTFWHISVLPGRQAAIESISSANRRGHIENNIKYIYLDDKLFDLLKNQATRDILRETLIIYWFPDHKEAISKLLEISENEGKLRSGSMDAVDEIQKAVPGRTAAFRRLVLEAYDFRCAASRWRVVLPDYSVLVEAAHIVPFGESHDDRPQNGIALTPNFHWAMDKNIIAPGPDLKWHVSKALDNHIRENDPLLKLEGRSVLLPKDKLFHPDAESLKWRLNQLLKPV